MALVPFDSAGSTAVTDMTGRSAMDLTRQPTQTAAFKRWVLFVRDGDRGSAEALKQSVLVDNECLVKDVDAMDSRPQWLRAVPTLLDVHGKQKYEGSAAINHLRTVVEREPLPWDNVNKGYFTFGEGDAWGAPADKSDFILPSVARDERYAATGGVRPEDVTAYMALRSGSGTGGGSDGETVKKILPR